MRTEECHCLNPNVDAAKLRRRFENDKDLHITSRNFYSASDIWRGEEGSLADLFVVLQSDLAELSLIFVARYYKTVSEGERPEPIIAESYRALACRCLHRKKPSHMICAWNDQAWSRLAKLLGKRIILTHDHSGDPPEYTLRGAYLPDGTVHLVNQTRLQYVALSPEQLAQLFSRRD